jgi:hypothetical protein
MSLVTLEKEPMHSQPKKNRIGRQKRNSGENVKRRIKTK